MEKYINLKNIIVGLKVLFSSLYFTVLFICPTFKLFNTICRDIYVFIKNGDVLYEETITTNMTMKPLTETEINDYVELDQPFKSCGSYMFEKNGYKLFSEVEGSLEAINGMPINYLLENLEKHV